MVTLALAMQLAVVQLMPVTIPRLYDVDLTLMKVNGDTLTQAFLRLAEDVEGQIMLSPGVGNALYLRTLVREVRETKCRVVTVGVGEAMMGGKDRPVLPRTTAQMCGVDTVQMGGGGTVMTVKVKALPQPDLIHLKGRN